MRASFLLLLGCFSSCVKSQSARQFRVGSWKIKSQSLDGQELDSDQWIVPKVKPEQPRQISMRIPQTHVLDTQLLENHGSQHLQQRTPGTRSKPSFSDLWLDHMGGSGRTEYQDSKESETVYTVVQRRSGDQSPSQLHSDVVVVNNGSAPQVIILPESSFDKKKLISQLRNIGDGKFVVHEGNSEEEVRELSEKKILTEILEDLDKESQVRKLNLLKERLQHKTEVYQTTLVNEANKRLTNVGISLHKQGQVLDQLTALPSETQTENENKSQSPTVNTKTRELLEKKKRLQNLLKSLRQLAQAKKNFAAFQPTLKHQDKILNNYN